MPSNPASAGRSATTSSRTFGGDDFCVTLHGPRALLSRSREAVMNTSSRQSCACGRHYEAKSWPELSLFARLSATDVASLATHWPAHLVVEVRLCASCGRKISTLKGGHNG
jgi:hypothetical protein